MFVWRIHEGLLGERRDELVHLLEGQGDHVQVVSGHWRRLPAPAHSGEAFAAIPGAAGLALTTLQDAARLPAQGWSAPRLLYHHQRHYDVSYWMPRIDGAIPLLNRGCLFVPVGMLSNISVPFESFCPDGVLFVRPDSGNKPFPGLGLDCRVLGPGGWATAEALLALQVMGGPMAPELMACLAPGKRLKPLEWRFWVVQRQVVASTPYSWTDEPLSWVAPPPQALALAEAVAGNAWQPDVAYVVDVVQLEDAEGDGAFFVNELNAASTSGLYAVPLAPLMAALKGAVLAERDGLIGIED